MKTSPWLIAGFALVAFLWFATGIVFYCHGRKDAGALAIIIGTKSSIIVVLVSEIHALKARK